MDRLKLETSAFDYDLPPEFIARFPLSERDQSRFLVYDRGEISHHFFHSIAGFLPQNSLLVFNNTRVVPARLHFQKPTRAWIEILIIDQKLSQNESLAHNQKICECMVGNKKKWPADEPLLLKSEPEGVSVRLEATWFDRERNLVLFTWSPPGLSFYEVLSQMGEMPIPPYLNRDSTTSDKSDYQTVYARNEGAIAAPTAGLHFTDSILNELRTKGFGLEELTLHVGLGTFRPMKSEKVADHTMHQEDVVVSKSFISALILHSGTIVAVGTTSMRSLESIFWIGARLIQTGVLQTELQTEEPYLNEATQYSRKEVLEAILDHLTVSGLSEFSFATRIYIMPGYKFRMVDGLITNFHQPKSTLLVLISAFVGEDWKKIYAEALENQYRFLSYGDSSLLMPTG